MTEKVAVTLSAMSAQAKKNAPLALPILGLRMVKRRQQHREQRRDGQCQRVFHLTGPLLDS